MTSALKIEGLHVDRAGHALLDQVDLQVDAGATLAITGPSGGGKTTLLRTIVGLEAPTRGEVLISGRLVSAANRVLVPPENRRITMVFQDLGLWPHMSAAAHLQFALAAVNYPKPERAARIDWMLESVGLHHRKQCRPATLSGGERQRLAIARALIVDPSIVLFDEPLSNLDVVLKRELIGLIASLLTNRQVTAIFVTHDPRETLPLTSDLAVLESGRIVQRGSMHELKSAPATPFVRQLAV